MNRPLPSQLEAMPFSRFGSYHAFSILRHGEHLPDEMEEGLWLRSVHGDAEPAVMGEHALASDIATRYCRLCSKSGFAENFDALTGEPLCDKAYTWTSSVFLVFAHRYLNSEAQPHPAAAVYQTPQPATTL